MVGNISTQNQCKNQNLLNLIGLWSYDYVAKSEHFWITSTETGSNLDLMKATFFAWKYSAVGLLSAKIKS